MLIPNAQVYTSPLAVNTHYPLVRVSFRLDLDAAAAIGRATAAVLPVLRDVTAAGGPDPEVVVLGAERGALEVEFRLWSPSTRSHRTAALHEAVPRSLAALAQAEVPLDEPRAVLVEGN